MVNAPVVEELDQAGQFYGTVSAERASDLESDVFLTYAETEDDLQTFTDDKLLGQIPAIETATCYAEDDKDDGLGGDQPVAAVDPVRHRGLRPAGRRGGRRAT